MTILPLLIPRLPPGMLVIGIIGDAGAGKDTFANFLRDGINMGGHPAFVTSYADPLKAAARTIFGLSSDDVNTQKGKARFNETWGLTNREILQKLGTEAIRDTFGPDVWIINKFEMLSGWGGVHPGPLAVIIPDVRFENEADAIIEQGGWLYRINRPDNTVDAGTHQSEGALVGRAVNADIDNSRTLLCLQRYALMKAGDVCDMFEAPRA